MRQLTSSTDDASCVISNEPSRPPPASARGAATPDFHFAANEAVRLEAPSDVAGLELIEAHITESLGRPFRFELELRAPARGLSAKQLLGRAFTLHVNLGSRRARHFHGLVSELRFTSASASHTHYRATLRPWVWFLSRTRSCRIFQHKTVVEILKEVFEAHPFSRFELDSLSGSYERRDFVVQYRESDLDFVTRLLEESGLYYYFEHGADHHTLMLCDDTASHEALAGYEQLPYLPPDAARREQLDHVERWEASRQVEASCLTLQSFDFERPRASLLATGLSSVEHALGELEAYDYTGDFTRADQGEAHVRLRMEQARLAAERFEGSTNCRALTCGRRFSLTGHPLADYNRAYLVTGTALHIEPARTESGGARRDALLCCAFSAARADRPFRLPRTTPKPVMHGAQTAIVTGPAREEIWVDQHGRVRVRFHWDRSRAGEPSSCWIRVAQAWAGAGFGCSFSPRVGDEVVVEFLDGDPDRPIIVGRVYNGANVAPCLLPENQTQSVIRSASSPGSLSEYSEIRFEDRSGKEGLFLQAQRDMSVRVKRSRSATVGGSDALAVGGNQNVRINGNASLRVGPDGGEYRLEAASAAQLEAPDYVELRCMESFIRLEPDRIQIVAGGKASVTLDAHVLASSSSGASLALDESAVCQSSDARATLRLDHDGTLESDIVRVNGAVVDIQGTTQVRINS